MNKTWELIKNFCKEEDGVVALEYGLVAALVTVGIIAAFVYFSGGLEYVLQTIKTKLSTIIS